MSPIKKILDRMMHLGLLAGVGFAALLCGLSPALAATAPSPGTAKSFAVLGDTTVNNTGAGTVITGNLGISPNGASSITGLLPAQVIGTIYTNPDAVKVLPWVHTVIANVKGNIRGIYDGGSPKHLSRYLSEFCYRFNRRFWEPQMLDRILTACVNITTITYAELKA